MIFQPTICVEAQLFEECDGFFRGFLDQPDLLREQRLVQARNEFAREFRLGAAKPSGLQRTILGGKMSISAQQENRIVDGDVVPAVKPRW